jgi:hypothetical protein
MPTGFISMSQGGNVGKTECKNRRTLVHQNRRGQIWYIKLRFNWNSAIGQDPFDSKTIYYGRPVSYTRAQTKACHGKNISPDLTMNNPEQQKQDETGGLTLDNNRR